MIDDGLQPKQASANGLRGLRASTLTRQLYVPLALRVDCVVTVHADGKQIVSRTMRCIREVAKFNGAKGRSLVPHHLDSGSSRRAVPALRQSRCRDDGHGLTARAPVLPSEVVTGTAPIASVGLVSARRSELPIRDSPCADTPTSLWGYCDKMGNSKPRKCLMCPNLIPGATSRLG